MRFTTLDLAAGNNVYEHAIGPIAFQIRVTSKPNDSRTEFLSISFRKGNEILIDNAIDKSENIEVPRVFVLESQSKDNTIILAGGRTLYWLDLSTQQISQTLDLPRDERDLEHWETLIYPTNDQLLIVCEADYLLIRADLNVAWHNTKYYNEVISPPQPGTSYVTSTDEMDTSTRFSLVDGQRIDQED